MALDGPLPTGSPQQNKRKANKEKVDGVKRQETRRANGSKDAST
jgi:hypothetical protein